MFYTLTKDALHLTNDASEYLAELVAQNQANIYTAIQNTPGGRTSNLYNLAVGCVMTALNLKLKISVVTKSAARTLYSTARLALNESLNYTFKDRAIRAGYNPEEPEQLEAAVYSLITGRTQTSTIKNSDISITIIEVPSGIRNISKLMSYNNVPELNIGVQQSREHAIRVYKYNKHLFVITNLACHMEALLKKLTGALPLIYNDLFTNLKEYPELYSYFESCFNENIATTTCLDIIKNTTFIKNLTKDIKNKYIERAFVKIEQNLIANIQHKISQTKEDITYTENNLLESYKKLRQLQITALHTTLPDKELILPFLTNNNDIKTIEFIRNTIILVIEGKVDYDKNEITKVLKGQSEFVRWVLTNPTIHLHWQACCSLNIVNNTVNNNSDYYNSNLLPNMHWRQYDCFGDNKTIIQKALVEQDFLTVFSKTITAAYQLNIYDITVLNRVIESLLGTYNYTKTFYNEENNTWISMSDLKDMFNKIKEEN